MSYVVACTYGNAWPDMLWAKGIKAQEDAERLRICAVEHGFRDARVLDAKDFKEEIAKKQRDAANKAAAYRHDRDVRGVRAKAR